MKVKRMVMVVLCIGLLLVGCAHMAEENSDTALELSTAEESGQVEETELTDGEPEKTDEPKVIFCGRHNREQNEAYKLFYGTWEITSVVSQHCRLGGDEGYDEIIGMQVTYRSGSYEFEGVKIEDPNYIMSIFPLRDDVGCTFLLDVQEQISMKDLLPDSDYFVWVQIVDMPWESAPDDVLPGQELFLGREFLIKDDETLYCFNYNCLYEMKRVSYMKGYDPIETVTYQDRW